MPVNAEFEGRTFDMPGTHTVTADELRAFATAVRSPQVADTPDGVVAPPTFAVTLAQRGEAAFIQHPGAGVDFSRLVHGEQSFVHHVPIRVGDELKVATTVQRVRNVGGNDMVTLVSEIATTGDEPRCTATSMMVIRAEEEKA